MLFCITGWFSDLQLITHYSNLFSNTLHTKPVCILFYYRRSGITGVEVGVTPVILSGTILKLFCRNFAFRNRNAEIGLENQYDSAKIRMVGISVVQAYEFKLK